MPTGANEWRAGVRFRLRVAGWPPRPQARAAGIGLSTQGARQAGQCLGAGGGGDAGPRLAQRRVTRRSCAVKAMANSARRRSFGWFHYELGPRLVPSPADFWLRSEVAYRIPYLAPAAQAESLAGLNRQADVLMQDLSSPTSTPWWTQSARYPSTTGAIVARARALLLSLLGGAGPRYDRHRQATAASAYYSFRPSVQCPLPGSRMRPAPAWLSESRRRCPGTARTGGVNADNLIVHQDHPERFVAEIEDDELIADGLLRALQMGQDPTTSSIVAEFEKMRGRSHAGEAIDERQPRPYMGSSRRVAAVRDRGTRASRTGWRPKGGSGSRQVRHPGRPARTSVRRRRVAVAERRLPETCHLRATSRFRRRCCGDERLVGLPQHSSAGSGRLRRSSAGGGGRDTDA